MKTLITIIFCSMIVLAFVNDAKGDDAGNPPSSKSKSTIKAWYDETWEAARFYRTTRVPGTDSLKYTSTSTPGTTGSPPTYSIPPNPATGAPGATISSDLVVTEWKVTGHTHFSSGI
ncbi:MAG: hypothetical protein P9L93_01700 [Candidatus Gorgyraea atricola]|nr:hypothetical protein [Candidatus Gorgyraea atricola]